MVFNHTHTHTNQCTTSLTCAGEGEEEEQQAHDKVTQEGYHAARDALGNRVHRLDEELEKHGHAAVEEDAHQDAGGVQGGCVGTEIHQFTGREHVCFLSPPAVAALGG